MQGVAGGKAVPLQVSADGELTAESDDTVMLLQSINFKLGQIVRGLEMVLDTDL